MRTLPKMSSLSKRTVFFIALSLMVSALAAGSSANYFSGTVSINDTAAPVGTVVKVYLDYANDTVVDGSTVVSSAGTYSNLLINGNEDDDGKILTFKVSDIITEENSTFDYQGEPPTPPGIFQVNLTAFDTNPPEFSGLTVRYPDGQTAIKNSESIDVYLNVTDEKSLVTSVTLNASTLNSSASSLTMNADDGSSYDWDEDGLADPDLYGATVIATGASESSHTITITAVDSVSNTDSTNALVVVDDTAPVTTDNVPVGWQNSSFTISFTATDVSGSGIASTYYKLNDGSWISGDSVLINNDGNHTVMYYSVDSAGNVESYNTIYAKLDTSSPSTSDDAPVGWQNSSFIISLTAVDVSGSGVGSTYYKLNDGSWTSGDSITINSDGNHTVMYYSVDSVGNIESNNTIYAKLDATAPSTSDDAPPGWQNSSFTISLTATDVSGSGVGSTYYKLNDGSWTSGDLIPINSDGNHTVMYYSVDSAGNDESYNTIYAKLDTASPVTSDDAPVGWQNSSFDINLTASDSSGSGVASTYYKLNDGSWTSGDSITINSDGNHTMLYYSVDSVGNVESNNTIYVKLDTVDPVTSDDAPDAWQSSDFVVNLTASDDSGSGINSTFYRMNNGTWEIGTSINISVEGNHSIEYYSDDVAGNIGTVNITYALLNKEVSSTTPSTSSTSSSSGGGGGGGGATNEEYENIDVKDAKSNHLRTNISARYNFTKESNPITGVEFIPLVNTGAINILIEVLHDTSSSVDTAPPGNVYRNMNIWVGKGGWASDKTISSPKVIFKIEKKWLEDKGMSPASIRLARYTSKWTVLSTEVLDEDDGWVYFSAEVPGFSPFAITAIQDEVEGNGDISNDGAKGSDSAVKNTEDMVDGSPSNTDEESPSTPGFDLITAIAFVSLASFFRRRI